MALTNAEHQARHRAKVATELRKLRRRVAELEAELARKEQAEKVQERLVNAIYVSPELQEHVQADAVAELAARMAEHGQPEPIRSAIRTVK